MRRLQLIQNAAARLLTGAGRRDHITPILSTLHWLPVSEQVLFKIGCFMHRIVHGGGPEYLWKKFTQYAPSRALRSAGQTNVVFPRVRKTPPIC